MPPPTSRRLFRNCEIAEGRCRELAPLTGEASAAVGELLHELPQLAAMTGFV
jgi:hypothetical protein